MKDIYIRTDSAWIKVTRFADKSFGFALGWKDDVKAFRSIKYSKEFCPTIKEAKEMAETMIADYK